MTHFDPVWLSTDEQIAALTEAYRGASLMTKMLGRFDLPDGVAHFRSAIMPWMRAPIVLVAQGKLEIDSHRIAFVPRPFRAFGWVVRDLRPDAAFEVPVPAITAVEPADVRSPVAQFFNIPFTRVRTTLPPPLDNILLCIGGRFSMPRIRERSIELRRALDALAPTSTAP